MPTCAPLLRSLLAAGPLSALVLAFAACYDPEPLDCTLRCGSGGCPEGMQCSNGWCASSGTTCLGSPETHARVEQDVEAAREVGVSGTPAFFVNGILLTGAKPVEEFVRVIERELEAKKS